MELQAKLKLVEDNYNSDPPCVVIKNEYENIVFEIDNERSITFKASELKKAIELLTSAE